MLDIQLRPVKDSIVNPLISLVPSFISPTHLTLIAFLPGLLSPFFSALDKPRFALLAWLLNRVFDGLDGAVARKRGKVTQWGGMLDIVCDFTVYTLIPIGVAYPSTTLALSFLLGSFHINNVILFYLASALPPNPKQLTSLHMTPALIEGMESFAIFCIMILLPHYFDTIAWAFTATILINIYQRLHLAKSAFEQVLQQQ